MAAVFAAIREKWGRLDFLIHSMAFAPKVDLQGRLVDSSVEGFLTAMDISCHSLVRMAKLAEPLMSDGGVLITMSHYGAAKVIPNYGLMGPVKAALESAVRYLSYELGPKGIRVHAVSPGPLKTRAASGLAKFDELLAEAELRAPEHDLVDILDIGATTAFLCSPFAKTPASTHRTRRPCPRFESTWSAWTSCSISFMQTATNHCSSCCKRSMLPARMGSFATCLAA
jgi:enoyl-[acyl-carrier protein] reductase I